MKSALKMSVKDDAQTREEFARLTEDELCALTKDAFFWGHASGRHVRALRPHPVEGRPPVCGRRRGQRPTSRCG